MAKKKKQGVVNPTRISAFDEDKKVQAIIETPKGNRNKYAWDLEQRVFELKKVLPEGILFPHDLVSSLLLKATTDIRLTFQHPVAQRPE